METHSAISTKNKPPSGPVLKQLLQKCLKRSVKHPDRGDEKTDRKLRAKARNLAKDSRPSPEERVSPASATTHTEKTSRAFWTLDERPRAHGGQ